MRSTPSGTARPGEGHRCVFKIVSRQNLYPNYRNDDYFLQKMLQTELIFNSPEDLAGQLKKCSDSRTMPTEKHFSGSSHMSTNGTAGFAKGTFRVSLAA